MSYDIDRLHEDMLAAIPDSYQKTVGFPAYDLSRAFALAVQSLSEDLDHAESKMDVDNMTGDRQGDRHHQDRCRRRYRPRGRPV